MRKKQVPGKTSFPWEVISLTEDSINNETTDRFLKLFVEFL
jgi:hypothetical protein